MQRFRHLIENWRVIANEVHALASDKVLDSTGMSREQIALSLASDMKWVSGWDGQRDWLNWGLAINGRFPLGDAMMPKTVSMLRDIEGLRFASISLFKPGTILKTHTHYENIGLSTFHLGLSVPKEQCFVCVNGAMIEEGNGVGFSFNGALPHFAFNASHEDRIILHCEFSEK